MTNHRSSVRRVARAAFASAMTFGAAVLVGPVVGSAPVYAASQEARPISIGDHVTITTTDGRTLTGEVVEANSDGLTLETMHGSIRSRWEISRWDIDAVEHHESPDSTDERGRRGLDDDRPDDDFDDRDRDDAADQTGGYILVSLDGEIGEEWTGQLLERVFREAESNDAEAVILHITSPGGFVDGLERIFKVIDERPAGVRLISYVDGDCFSAAAILALTCDEFYVGPRGVCGAAVMWSREGDRREAVDAKIAGAVVARWRARAEEQGRPGAVIDAMALQEAELWVDQSTTPWKVFGDAPRGSDLVQIDDRERVLSLTARQAVAMGVARAQVRSIDELLDRLELDNRERIAWDADRHVRRHVATVERTLEETWDVVNEYDELIAAFEVDEDTTVRDVRIWARDLRARLKRLERLGRQHEHVEILVNEATLEDWIENLEDVIAELRDPDF